MIKYLWLIIFLAPWCNNNLSSQVRGQIIDAKTKQPLAGANIYTNRGVGVAVADKKGEFMINNGELLHNIDTLWFFFCRISYKKICCSLFIAKEKCDFIARRAIYTRRSICLWHKKNLLTFAIYTNIINACPTIFVCNDFIRKETVYYRWR